MKGSKPGIVLMNMGAPGSVREVRAFLFRLFQDRELFPFPGGRILQPFFAGLVALLRAPRVEHRYRVLPGGGSPLLAITREQASRLERKLAGEGLRFPVEVAMRYSRPLSGDALRSLEARGANAIIGLPLYPQFSRATSGSSLRALRSILERDFPSWRFWVIESWHGDSGFHRSIAKRVASGLEKFGGMQGVGVLFIAHSLPVRFVEEGDPYVRQVEETVEGIRRELADLGFLKGVPAFLAYQGQVGPVKWVGPAVPTVLQEMVWKQIRRVLVVPVSFVSDHLETLYEIDLQYRRVALELGIEQFERIESLNGGEDFVDVLLGLVLRACMPEERKEGWQG